MKKLLILAVMATMLTTAAFAQTTPTPSPTTTPATGPTSQYLVAMPGRTPLLFPETTGNEKIAGLTSGGVPTPPMTVTSYLLKSQATLNEVFSGIETRWTVSQIGEFCRKNPSALIFTDGHNLFQLLDGTIVTAHNYYGVVVADRFVSPDLLNTPLASASGPSLRAKELGGKGVEEFYRFFVLVSPTMNTTTTTAAP